MPPKQNKSFSCTLVILFLFFALVITYGGRKIYDGEKKRINEQVVAKLQFGKDVLKSFFNIDLKGFLFLKNLSITKSYIESDFESGRYKDGIKDIFYSFCEDSQVFLSDQNNRFLRE